MIYHANPAIEIEAHQWHKNGDHPGDACGAVREVDGTLTLSEGHVVRHFRDPTRPGTTPCQKCQRLMSDHGWIDTLEGGHIVCPGDYIVTGTAGEFYPVKPDIFARRWLPGPAPLAAQVARPVAAATGGAL